jgi:hypothetical protein
MDFLPFFSLISQKPFQLPAITASEPTKRVSLKFADKATPKERRKDK